MKALSEVSVRVDDRDVVAVLGANGAGKTTPLRTLPGLLPARGGGSVHFLGEDITRLKPAERVRRGS